MIYSARLNPINKETWHHHISRLTARSPFCKPELSEFRDAAAQMVGCKVHELGSPLNALNECKIKNLCNKFGLFGARSVMISRFYYAVSRAGEVKGSLTFPELLGQLQSFFGNYDQTGSRQGQMLDKQLELYFRIYDWEEDGFVSHMDLFQALSENNYHGLYHPPTLIQVISRLFEALDDESRGMLSITKWKQIAKIPELTALFWNFLELPVHPRQCAAPIKAPLNLEGTTRVRDMVWAPEKISYSDCDYAATIPRESRPGSHSEATVTNVNF